VKTLSYALDQNADALIDDVDDEIDNIMNRCATLKKRIRSQDIFPEDISGEIATKKSFTRSHHINRENEITILPSTPNIRVDFDCKRNYSDFYSDFNVDTFQRFLLLRQHVDNFCEENYENMYQGNLDELLAELKRNYSYLFENKHIVAYFFWKLCESNSKAASQNFTIFKTIFVKYDYYSYKLLYIFRRWGALLASNNSCQWIGGVDSKNFTMSTVHNQKINPIDLKQLFCEIQIDNINYLVPSNTKTIKFLKSIRRK
jgi:hypothetical protein